jgi:rSAM/selenodomain-associated transferase 2
MPRLSIIIPVLNEGEAIGKTLDALADLRGLGVETVVVDGGSRDATVQRARMRVDRVVLGSRGRAIQMNEGAEKATGDVLLFLHADSRLPREADHLILDGLARTGLAWGHFDVNFEGRHPLLKVIAWLMNLRSRVTGIATGDQAIFVSREAFDAVGGFPQIAVMEDLTLCKQLKRESRALRIPDRVVTSGRRFEQNGVVSTLVLMARMRLAYLFGADPDVLARRFGYGTGG